jgi:hypothetical protein
MDLEGVQGVSIVRGDEDDLGKRCGWGRGDRPNDLEATHAWHLDVQKNEIGALFYDGGDSRFSAVSLSYDLNRRIHA